MVNGTMCRHTFALLLMMEVLLHEIIVMNIIRKFVVCVVTNSRAQLVGSAMRGIAINVLIFKLVEMKLCMLQHNFWNVCFNRQHSYVTMRHIHHRF